MLITRFNRMIRNRLLWGFFAVIVIISFVAWGSNRGGCEAESRTRGVEGRLFGEDVSSQEFFLARFFQLNMRDDRALSPELNRLLRRETWKRLAALRAADRLALSVSDEELSGTIQRDPSFAVEGRFDPRLYRNLVESNFRVGVPMFEAYLRQEIALRKLRQMIRAAVWTAPSELEDTLRNLSDEFTVEYVRVPTNAPGLEADLDEAAVRAYFEQDLERFRIPEKISVRYAVFPVTNFLASARVDGEDVARYYERHSEEFISVTTNGVTVTQTLAAVSGAISNRLTRQAAAFSARDAATEFVMALAPDRYGRALSLDEAARAQNVTVWTSDFFAAGENVPGIAAGLAAGRAAFRLDAADPEGYFSDAIMGSNAVYVLAAGERADARVPDFAEAADRVRPLAEREALRAAMRDRLESAAAEIRRALDEGRPFADAAAEQGLEARRTAAFTVYDGITNDVADADALVGGVMALEQGELSDVIETPGAALLAYVAEREMGDLAGMQLIRPQVLDTLSQYRADILFDEWLEFNLAQGALEDLRPAAGGDEEAEPADEDDEDVG